MSWCIPGFKARGCIVVGECWHKKSTFKEHLLQTYKILKIWGQPAIVCDCMLFHSAYSNSYVNLAIFKADVDRARLSTLVGEETEALIHKFCVVPRHELIYEKLLWKLTDDAELDKAPDGIMVKHIKTGTCSCTEVAPGASAEGQPCLLQHCLLVLCMPTAVQPG